jgi:lincosamide nucleotidyltransferase A/C/D/E
MSEITPFCAERVLDVYRSLEGVGVRIWLDGGWGVDALLGVQTRDHTDLDIVVQQKDLSRMTAQLMGLGFRDHPRADTRPWNFVLINDTDELVDVHVVNIAPNGDGIYGPPENAETYPAAALRGTGKIREVSVCCLSAAYQLENHTGYPLRKKDRDDVAALAVAFGRPK